MKSNLIPLKHRPDSLTWIIDPSLVPGNFRKNVETMTSSLVHEKALNHGFLEFGLNFNEREDPFNLDKNYAKKRQKIGKSSKKNLPFCKDAERIFSSKQDRNASLHNSNLSSKPPKGNYTLSHISSINCLELPEFCKEVKIHRKPPSGSQITPCLQKAPMFSVHNVPFTRSPSPARSQFNSACKANQAILERKLSREQEPVKQTKIFLSEKQSGVVLDCGMSVPCAPPTTPTSEQLGKFEYIPSLQDIRAQRSFRHRLEMLESQVLKKEQRKQEEHLKAEKFIMRERMMELKRRQRLEIYALNKVMTDLEKQRFTEFTRGIKC